MKKKALMTILPLCVAMAMTACGGNADTAEVKETTVAEETVEADVETEEEAGEQAESAETDEYYEAGRRSLYGLDGAQIDLEDAHTNLQSRRNLAIPTRIFILVFWLTGTDIRKRITSRQGHIMSRAAITPMRGLL